MIPPLWVALGLAAAGCGGTSKLSAKETSKWLMHHRVAKGIHIVCRPGRGNWSRWDYACTLTGRGLSGTAADNTYGYNVDSHGVTDFSG